MPTAKTKPPRKKRIRSAHAAGKDRFACPVCRNIMISLCRCPEGHACCPNQHYWCALAGGRTVEKTAVTALGNEDDTLRWVCDLAKAVRDRPRRRKHVAGEGQKSNPETGKGAAPPPTKPTRRKAS